MNFNNFVKENIYRNTFDGNNKNDTYLLLLEATMLSDDYEVKSRRGGLQAQYVVELYRRNLMERLADLISLEIKQNNDVNERRAA